MDALWCLFRVANARPILGKALAGLVLRLAFGDTKKSESYPSCQAVGARDGTDFQIRRNLILMFSVVPGKELLTCPTRGWRKYAEVANPSGNPPPSNPPGSYCWAGVR